MWDKKKKGEKKKKKKKKRGRGKMIGCIEVFYLCVMTGNPCGGFCVVVVINVFVVEFFDRLVGCGLVRRHIEVLSHVAVAISKELGVL